MDVKSSILQGEAKSDIYSDKMSQKKDFTCREKISHMTNTIPYAVYQTEFPVEGEQDLYLHWHPEAELFYVQKGELAVILGTSGAGKTTALNILGGMDTPTSGEIIVDGNNITAYNAKQLVEYRRTDIGFVFQFYNLVPNLTALENVELAAQVCSDSLDAGETLDKFGLENRKNNFPAQLSGGEQQRVAIARAIAKNPKLLLCDEPTGALDYNTGKQILKLLQDTCRNEGMTVVLITNNAAITPMAYRVIRMRNSRVESMEINETPVPVENIEW